MNYMSKKPKADIRKDCQEKAPYLTEHTLLVNTSSWFSSDRSLPGFSLSASSSSCLAVFKQSFFLWIIQSETIYQSIQYLKIM